MYVVIMAGGVGTRFWPKSRFKRPKQLLKILDDRTMIQATVDRLDQLVSQEKIFVVTTQTQTDEIKKQIPFLQPSNYIIEPKGKNTAPCIGLAALMLKKSEPDEVMAVLPADHRIQNELTFRKTLAAANQLVLQKECLVTIGINPTYPSTGYGYIQFNKPEQQIDGEPVHKVKTFAEKPDLKTAKLFLKSGDFLWNSGMFIWKAKTILAEIEKSLPELYDGLMEIEKHLGTKKEAEVIQKVYSQIKSISIDYGVMEHTDNVYVLKGDFEWNDVGSWEEVYKISTKDDHGNVMNGRHLLKDSENCFVDSEHHLIATIGVENLIIIESDGAILICPREKAQEVKELVDALKRKNLQDYL